MGQGKPKDNGGCLAIIIVAGLVLWGISAIVDGLGYVIPIAIVFSAAAAAACIVLAEHQRKRRLAERFAELIGRDCDEELVPAGPRSTETAGVSVV